MDEEIKTRAKSRNLYENLEKKLIFIKCERLELNHANFAWKRIMNYSSSCLINFYKLSLFVSSPPF